MIPDHIRTMAQEVLTEKQFEAFELEQAGWGIMRIARHLTLTKTAVADRIHNAHTKLEKTGVRMDEFGKWYIEEAA